jgi:prepilin-type N-terminal cleavage/methylation domain-containing protein
MVFLRAKSRGVTLVELSIVLAILGILIVVGISGRSLIDISRATATVEYLGNRSIAFQTFETTYGCLPGDCSLTSVVGSTGSLITVGIGNGDTQIQAFSSTTTKDEISFVEEHFYKAQLFNRSVPTVAAAAQNDLTTILPVAKIPGSYVSSMTVNSAMHHVIGGIQSAATDVVNGNLVSYPAIFRIIDSKLDDGDATKGSVLCSTTAITATATTTNATGYNGITGGCVLVSKV